MCNNPLARAWTRGFKVTFISQRGSQLETSFVVVVAVAFYSNRQQTIIPPFETRPHTHYIRDTIHIFSYGDDDDEMRLDCCGGNAPIYWTFSLD